MSTATTDTPRPVVPPTTRPRRRWPRPLTGALAGVALTFAFDPYGLWWLAPLCVAALALAVRGLRWRAAALVGLAFGLGEMVPLLHWTGVYVGPVPWLILAVVQALYFAPLGVGVALCSRLPAPGAVVGGAAVWVVEEAVRGRWPYGGFTWGRLAFSQADAPWLRVASLGGAPLVTFVVALIGMLLAVGLVEARRHRVAPAAGCLAALVVLALAAAAVPAPVARGRAVTVALVQGNVPRIGLDIETQQEQVLRYHVAETQRLAAAVAAGRVARPDLVIWPENASDVDPYADPQARELIQEAVDAVGVPVLVGAVVTNPLDPNTLFNMGIVWGPLLSATPGPGPVYVKQHPVPFAEYIPMRRLARFFSSAVDRVSRNFAKGAGPGVLQIGPARVGDVICFEVSDDTLVRRTVDAGAQLIAVQTNNATFGHTPETRQQLAMSRLRAVEHGRWVLIAATSGISAAIAPDGRVVQRTQLFTPATVVQQVRLSDSRTLADRLGNTVELLLVLVGVGAVVLGGRRREEPTSTP
ncbi:MAG TPA: apolipoprotein N-acyltransferase [Actinomycetes bacterium]|nr:apolipoprotein N-acyltransferase [Actinomycetes bacterium]